MAEIPGLRIPEPLSFDGNVAENWRHFENNFNIYRKAVLKKKDADEVAYIFLNLAGQEAIDREKTFVYLPEQKEGETVIREAENKEDPECLIRKFRELCRPQSNVIVERHRFNARDQRNGETMEAYVSELRKLANNCEYGELKDELIRDRIVCGVQKSSKKTNVEGKRPNARTRHPAGSIR